MSRTTAITYNDRSLWPLVDALGVWPAYLVEEIARQEIPHGRFR